MKSVLLSALALVATVASAEVKPFGTILSELCGHASKSAYVCTATQVGTHKRFVTISGVSGKKQIEVRSRRLNPTQVVYKSVEASKPLELLVTTRNGKSTGRLKLADGTWGPAFTMDPIFHTQGV